MWYDGCTSATAKNDTEMEAVGDGVRFGDEGVE